MVKQMADPDPGLERPVFLIGMPRSGTKLLREILNGHSRLRFSDIETEFLPYWVSNWPKLLPAATHAHFAAFDERCRELPFFVQLAEMGNPIDRDRWFEACNAFTPAAVFSGLMRSILGISSRDGQIMWGDKSPSYIHHIPLLLQQFPACRIVHIIRDVRDYALSMRQAWHKNALRATQRWHDDVLTARNHAREFRESVMEIRYEDLLTEPRTFVEVLCNFLGVAFEEEMLCPDRIVENIGAAKGTSSIMRSNIGKYVTRMPPRIANRIEMIAGEILIDLGYPCSYRGPSVRVAPWMMKVFQAIDAVNVIRSGLTSAGAARSLRFHIEYFRTSGNRNR
jgi:hypothetical protein